MLHVAGNIIVNGIAASTYSSVFGSERAMHWATSWGRLLWLLAPQFCKSAFILRHSNTIASSYQGIVLSSMKVCPPDKHL